LSIIQDVPPLDSQQTRAFDISDTYACGWCFGETYDPVGKNILIATIVAQDANFTARSDVAQAIGTAPSGPFGPETPNPCAMLSQGSL